MTDFLARLLGRLPIGWLQLTHNKTRLAAALAGVAFANILVFMQLGFLGALLESIRLPYRAMDGDILISASDMMTLADGLPIPRQRMYQALAVDGVARAAPIYYGKIDWRDPQGGVLKSLDVIGIDPAVATFKESVVGAHLAEIMRLDAGVLDRKTRNAPKAVFEAIAAGKPYTFEAKGRTLSVVGLFEIGGGFGADGYLIVSDQTFFKLFPQRAAGAPNHILVGLAPGADAQTIVARLRNVLPSYDSRVDTLMGTASFDQAYQMTQRPVGLVFGMGIVIGVLVGVVIVYQVLSTDVADHLKEYATFKAMGYPARFFLSIVFEEALVLALVGFLPGVLISLTLYAIVAHLAALPVQMTFARAALVLLGTIVMCVISGALATRRLARANPADLF